TADPRTNPVAGAALPAPAVSVSNPPVASAESAPAPHAVPVPTPVVQAEAVPPSVVAPVMTGSPEQPRAETVAESVATVPVAEAASEAPVVDLPWEEQCPAAAPTPAVTAASAQLSEAPESAPEQLIETARAPTHDELPQVDADSDDEPPPGDYDYVEMDAEAFDYDFDAAEPAQPVEPEPLPAAQPATGLAADWLELFPKLGLSGMTGSIGANCTLIAVDGDRWLLHLDPGHSALFNPTQQRRLNDALNQYHGRELSLQIELRTPEQETPAQAAARKRANRQREAEASIHNDPLVQQMIQQFAAIIRADSIEPVDTAINP
ncbi:DNA polymerase III subunit gamma/tau, partial [Pseudomonas sp. CrR25]|nr:DNA polymerase III subunit gamma/tau [Pseudomonas sp. CrR25]